ncbi:MAG: hypothetical protein FWH41_04880 [Treponema sp.]|nr:hypothetical protein [Treponema sp.]
MKFFIFIFGFSFVAFFNLGCVSTINDTKLNITIDNIKPVEILLLQNVSDNVTLYRIGSKVMEHSGFINQSGEKFGYYAITIESRNNVGHNYLIFGWINGLTLFIPSLIGFPTESTEFIMTANLFIFDSTGTFIKTYKNSNKFTKTTGLYYGHDPHKKASAYYSILFKEILELANIEKDEINFLLEEAGPITNDNIRSAREKITEYFKTKRN